MRAPGAPVTGSPLSTDEPAPRRRARCAAFRAALELSDANSDAFGGFGVFASDRGIAVPTTCAVGLGRRVSPIAVACEPVGPGAIVGVVGPVFRGCAELMAVPPVVGVVGAFRARLLVWLRKNIAPPWVYGFGGLQRYAISTAV